MMEIVRDYFLGTGFSWAACLIAVVVVLWAGIMSVDSPKQWWIVVAELILFPVVSGMVVPHFSIPFFAYWPLACAAFLITWHWCKLWWPEECLAHRHNSQGDKRNWYRDMNTAGWINFAFMIVQLVMLGAYLLSPVPVAVVRKVVYPLILVVLVAVVKPAEMERWQIPKRKIFLTTGTVVGLWTAIAIVSWIKLSMK